MVTIQTRDVLELRALTVAIEAKYQELMSALGRGDLAAANRAEADRNILFWQLQMLTIQVLQ